MNDDQKKLPPSDSGSVCDPELVKRFVGSQLADGELAELENHLGVCPACQSLIETETTEAENWSEAMFSLRDNQGWYSAGSTTSEVAGLPGSDTSGEYVKRMILKSLGKNRGL